MSITSEFKKNSQPHEVIPFISTVEKNIEAQFPTVDLFYHYLSLLQKDLGYTALSKQIKPPEVLCSDYLVKSIKDYRGIPLTSNDTLFKPIHEAIQALYHHKDTFSLEGKDYVQKLIDLYNTFIENVCQKAFKERSRLLKGYARIYGVGEKVLLIEQKKAREMVSIDNYGQPVEANLFREHLVQTIGEAYFKRASQGSITFSPIDHAAALFHQVLSSSNFSSSLLIKIEGIWIKDPFSLDSEKNENRKIIEQKQAEGQSLSEIFAKFPPLKASYPFKAKKVKYIIQASSLIEGVTLTELLSSSSSSTSISSYSFSVSCLMGICLTPSEGRNDCYKISKDGHLIKVQDDHPFESIFIEEENEHCLNFRYAPFLLPQMSQPIDPKFVKQLKEMSVNILLLNWLSAIHTKNLFYQKLLEKGVITKAEFENLNPIIKISLPNLQYIEKTLTQAQDFVETHPQATHWELLSHLCSPLAFLYQKERELLLNKKKPIIWERVSKEPFSSSNNFQKNFSIEKKPLLVLYSWISSLSFQTSEQEKTFLKQLLQNFPDLERLSLSTFLLDDASLISLFSEKNSLKELTLRSFPTLTSKGICFFIEKNPYIRLILGDMHQIKIEEFVLIVQEAWKKKMSLSFVLSNQTFPINPENINQNLQESVKRGSLFYTQLFLALGGDLHQKNNSGDTLLHLVPPHRELLAAFLLEKGLSPNEKNIQGFTPMLIAAKRGDLKAVKICINHQGDMQTTTAKKETIFHLAAESGDPFLLNFLIGNTQDNSSLLNDNPCQIQTNRKNSKRANNMKFIEIGHHAIFTLKDEKGEQPLHKATIGFPKDSAVQILLDAGANPSSQNNEGNTPLHLASQHGHGKSARLLLKKQPDIFSLSNNKGETPLDLALASKKAEILHLFIDPKSFVEKEEIVSNNQDIEGLWSQNLIKARTHGDAVSQLIYVEKIGELYLQKVNDLTDSEKADGHPAKYYIRAAHLFNAALALAIEYNFDSTHQAFLFSKLEKIELLLLESLGIKSPFFYKGTIDMHRRFLKEVREKAKKQLDEDVFPEKIQEEITEGFQELLIMLIKESILLMQEEPPTKFAVMGLGSMSRKEMCPYSDVEFAFIIEKDTPENRAYFRKLSQLIEIKSINLGETRFPIIPQRKIGNQTFEAESITPNGFSMDIGGLIPGGKEGIYELIGSAEELANFQNPSWLEKNNGEIILVNGLTSYIFITGHKKLFEEYEKTVMKTLDKKSPSKKKIRQERAISLLKGHVDEFRPYLEEERIDLRAFDAKKDFYRPIQMMIGALSVYYKLDGNNTFENIGTLIKKNVLSKKNGEKLKEIVIIALKWRMKAHLFYQNEKEIFYYSKIKENIDETLYSISDEEAKYILEMYRTLIPTQRALKEFIQGNEKAFLTISCYDPTFEETSKKPGKTYDFNARERLCIQMAVINPNSINALKDVHQIKKELAKYQDSLKYAQETLELTLKKYGNAINIETALNLYDLGEAYINLGNLYEGENYYRQALEMYKKIAPVLIDQEKITPLIKMVIISNFLNNNVEMEKFLFQLLSIEDKIHFNAPTEQKAWIFHNLAIHYCRIGNSELAFMYANQFVEIEKVLCEDKTDIKIIKSLSFLNHVYMNFGKIEKANQLKKEIKKTTEAFVEKLELKEPSVEDATTLSKIANECESSLQGIDFHKKALNMLKRLYNEPHPNIINQLQELGNYYLHNSFQNQEPLDWFTLALKMQIQLYGDTPHSKTAELLAECGNFYSENASFERAIEFYEKALKVHEAITNGFPGYVLVKLAGLYAKIKNYEKSVEYNRQALNAFESLLSNSSKKTPDMIISNSLREIGDNDYDLKRYDSALLTYNKALELDAKIGNRNNFLLIFSLYTIHHELGNKEETNKYSKEIKRIVTIFNLTKTNIDNTVKNLKNLEPHLMILNELREKYKNKPHPEIVEKLLEMAKICENEYAYVEARKFYLEAIEIKKTYKTKPYHEIANLLDEVAWLSVFYLQDNATALVLAEESLQIRKNIYGDFPHNDIAKSYTLFSNIYSLGMQERETADKFQAKALEIEKRKNDIKDTDKIKFLEQDLRKKSDYYKNKPHLDILEILVQLGDVCIVNNIDKAISYYKKALEISKVLYENKEREYKENIFTYISCVIQALVNICKKKGKQKEALQYYVEFLELEKRGDRISLPNHSTRTAQDMIEMCDDCLDWKLLDEAIKFYKRAIELSSTIDPSNYNIQSNIRNIVRLSINIGCGFLKTSHSTDTALFYYKQALELHEKYLKNEIDSNLGILLFNLGIVYEKTDICQAIHFHQEALKVRKRIYENNNNEMLTDIIESLKELSDLYKKEGEYEKVCAILKEELEVRTKLNYHINPDSDFYMNLYNLGDVFLKLKNLNISVDFFNQALTVGKKIFQGDASKQIVIASNLLLIGNIYKTLGDLEQAIANLEESLNIFRIIEKSPQADSRTVKILELLSTTYNLKINEAKAVTCLKELLATYQNLPSNDQLKLKISRVLVTLGNIYVEEKPKEAIEHLDKALLIQKTLQANTSNAIPLTLKLLGTAYKNLGDMKNAINYHNEVIIKKNILKIPCSYYDYSELGVLYYSDSNFKDALNCFEKCLQIIEENSSIKQTTIYLLLMLMGSSNFKLKNHLKATGFYLDAINLKNQLDNGKITISLASIYYDLIFAYSGLGDEKKTFEALLDFCSNRKNAIDKPAGKDGTIPYTCGTVHYDWGNLRKALSFFEESYEINKKIYEQEANLINTNTLILDLIYISCVNYDLKEINKSIIYGKEALEIGRKIFKDSPMLEYLVLSVLGEGYAFQGNGIEAIKYHQEAIKVAEKLSTKEMIGSCSSKLGYAYLISGNKIQAQEYLETGLSILEEAFREDPKVETKENTAYAHYRLGLFYKNNKDFQKAVDFFNQSLKIFREVKGLKPNSTIAKILKDLGDTYKELKVIDNSVKHYKEAEEMEKILFKS